MGIRSREEADRCGLRGRGRQDFNLPLLDEPVPRRPGQYCKQHTKAWAAKVGSFDGSSS